MSHIWKSQIIPLNESSCSITYHAAIALANINLPQVDGHLKKLKTPVIFLLILRAHELEMNYNTKAQRFIPRRDLFFENVNDQNIS